MSSDGKHENRAVIANKQQRYNAAVLVERVNSLLEEIGVAFVEVNDGFRDASVNYGAKFSAHKEGKAVDIRDINKLISGKSTQDLLIKHRLRREDNDFTPGWVHYDTRQPYGIFKP